MQKPPLKSSFRRSTGPLYSKSELAKAEKFLAEMGLTQKTDKPELGFRIYAEPGKQGTAVVYLDELGAHPDNSGIMTITRNGELEATTVWDFAKKESIARTKNPVLRGIRKALNF